MLGSFAERAVISQYSVVKVPPATDLLTAALFSCGIPTGWGTAVIAGDVEPGDVVVIFGAGGIGMNAVQGAAYSGAAEVIVVDPVRMKRDTAKKFGATRTFATAAEAITEITKLSGEVMADKALVTVGEVTSEVALAAQSAVGRSGEVVITAPRAGCPTRRSPNCFRGPSRSGRRRPRGGRRTAGAGSRS